MIVLLLGESKDYDKFCTTIQTFNCQIKSQVALGTTLGLQVLLLLLSGSTLAMKKVVNGGSETTPKKNDRRGHQ